VVAEPLSIQIEQAMAVAVLLLRHGLEHFGRGRVLRPQTLGEIVVDAGVFLFQGNRQRQQFLFREIGKILRHFQPTLRWP
jgi:hypothetical protein